MVQVRAVRKGAVLRRISFCADAVTGEVELQLSSAGCVQLQMGGVVYKIVACPPPQRVLYSESAAEQEQEQQAYPAALLDAAEGSTVAQDEASVLVLQGDCVFDVNGHAMRTEGDALLHEGKWYREGDSIEVGGRTAVVRIG